MRRAWIAAIGFALSGLLTAGCDTGGNGAKKAEEGTKKTVERAKEALKEAGREAKEAVKEAGKELKEAAHAAKVKIVDPMRAELPKFEEKMKDLSGEKLAKAKEKLAEFKKQLADFEAAAPDKWESLKEGLHKSYDDLKQAMKQDK